MKPNAERQKLFNSFADPQGSDSHAFSLSRKQDDGLTFSQDSIDQFKEMINLFIGGRIAAFMDRTGKAARGLVVTVDVKVSDEPIQPPGG